MKIIRIVPLDGRFQNKRIALVRLASGSPAIRILTPNRNVIDQYRWQVKGFLRDVIDLYRLPVELKHPRTGTLRTTNELGREVMRTFRQ
jgi:hypothetical protein